MHLTGFPQTGLLLSRRAPVSSGAVRNEDNMKPQRIFLSMIVLFVTIAGLCLGDKPPEKKSLFDEPEKMKTFYSLKKLKHYATSPTALSAGGKLHILELDGTNVYIVDRSFTMGIQSSEITVYIVEKGVLRPRLFIPGLHSCAHSFEVNDDCLTIYRTSSGKKKFKVATVHKDGLLLPIQAVGKDLSEDQIDPELKNTKERVSNKPNAPDKK